MRTQLVQWPKYAKDSVLAEVHRSIILPVLIRFRNVNSIYGGP